MTDASQGHIYPPRDRILGTGQGGFKGIPDGGSGSNAGRGLRKRLARTSRVSKSNLRYTLVVDSNTRSLADEPGGDVAEPAIQPAPARAPPVHIPPPVQRQPPLQYGVAQRRTPSPPPSGQRQPPRSPLQVIEDPPEPRAAGSSRTLYADDEEQPRRRKVPASRQSPSPPPAPRQPIQSRYFAAPDISGKGKGRAVDLSRDFRLSPHRQRPVVVPDSDDEYTAPARKVPTFRGNTAPPVVVHPDPEDDINGETGNISPKSSSDFDYEFDFNDAELHATLDKVEQEALASSDSATLVATSAPSGSGNRAVSLPTTSLKVTSSRRTVVATGAQAPTTYRAVSRGRSGTPARTQATVHIGVVTVDDDDSDEKENIPAPTRHVRRRMDLPIASQVRPDDIIEISD